MDKITPGDVRKISFSVFFFFMKSLVKEVFLVIQDESALSIEMTLAKDQG